MFNPGGLTRARVLLIEAGGGTLFRWQRGALRLFERYTSHPADLMRFENLLHKESKVPFIIVIDCIEEDFRIETFAHVTGSDRAKMLERKLSFAFRNTPYKIARVVGREKEGRKDDRVLLTALTKAELVDPWITRILKEKLAILCVTSAAYMMELLAVSLQLRSKPHVLLVNIESGTGMRQTYLQKGRVIFSRLTPITERLQEDLTGMVQQQSLQTRKYLERIKQVPYDTLLPVHMLNYGDLTFALPEATEADLLSFQQADAHRLIPESSLELKELEVGPLAVSLVQALRGKGLKNVYASAVQRRFQLLNNINKSMYAAAATLALGAVGVVAPTISETLALWEQEQSTIQRTLPLQQQYEQLRASFPETPIESSTMALVVSTHDVLSRQTHDPTEILQLIGHAMETVPSMQLRSIDWELTPRPLTETEAMALVTPISGAEAFLHYSLKNSRTDLVLAISGLVQNAPDFRSARNDILRFINAVEATSGIRVEPIEMPVEVRSDTRVVTRVDDELVNAPFVLRIVKSGVEGAMP